jgi:hypothetical protein
MICGFVAEQKSRKNSDSIVMPWRKLPDNQKYQRICWKLPLPVILESGLSKRSCQSLQNQADILLNSRPDSISSGKLYQDDCAVSSDKDISDEHWRFCPQCGRELINEKCKLRCPRCHYFMSCSDFDFAN